MKSVYIVGGDRLIERMFTKNGWLCTDVSEDADLICFTGGSDVNPFMYGEDVHRTTRYDAGRDVREAEVFKKFQDKPKVGICRGSQFLNVMSGGSLWQDVNNHAIGGTHDCFYLTVDVYDYDWKKKFPKEAEQGSLYKQDGTGVLESHKVTSTHHQMMRPKKTTSELWGFAFMSTYRDRGDQHHKFTNFDYSPDVEIVFYRDTKSLCFQPHPEYGVKSCEDLFFTCLKRAFG